MLNLGKTGVLLVKEITRVHDGNIFSHCNSQKPGVMHATHNRRDIMKEKKN